MSAGQPITQFPLPPAPLIGTELVPMAVIGAISGISQATNAVVTVSNPSSANPFTVGQSVALNGVGGMVQINGLVALVSAIGGVQGAWTFTVPINSSAFTAYTAGGVASMTYSAHLGSMQLAAGTYNPTFQSGNVQWIGANGLLAADNNMIYGQLLPNPSGVVGPCLLLGSGGGGGVPVTFAIIMDQAFDNVTPGNRLIITSGETQPAGTQPGGSYLDYGGASFGGTGGLRSVQGGSSANAAGGPAVFKGGAATGSTGAAIPGDAFVEGGDTGQQGANVHLIMTLLNGVAGDVRIRVNSTILIQFLQFGEIFLTQSGTGAGSAGQALVSGGLGAPAKWRAGFSGTRVIGGETYTWDNGQLLSII